MLRATALSRRGLEEESSAAPKTASILVGGCKDSMGGRFMRKHVIVGILLAAIMAFATTAEAQKVETKLGLYVTAKEAYDMWRVDPEKVKILDVRTLAEYVFVGHAPMAYSVPAFFQTHRWDAKRKMFAMEPNPDFVAQVSKWADPSDTILATCRSGERGAMAVDRLAAAGFTKVYNITDGMEGSVVDDPESVFHGRRMKNGWKNSGLPLTYEIDLTKVWLPKEP
jgi:rhodanese-related sulfurtransferase